MGVTTKEKRRKYYEDNKYDICNNTLNKYCVKKIEEIRNLHTDRVNDYIERYPFEKCADLYIKSELYKHKVFSMHDRYADCYDAGMMAYLYNIKGGRKPLDSGFAF